MENWLETDETQEAVLALQIAGELIPRVVDNPHYWSWVIVALHNSLQGFMVLALRGTNNLNVLTDECAAQWMEAYERGDGAFPEPKLDSFLNLYKKIKSNRMEMYVDSLCFKPTGTQGRSVKKLNQLRNEVIHFVPKGWRLEFTGLPGIVEDCLAIVDFLAFRSGNIFWRDEILEGKTRALIDKARIDMNYVARIYGA